MLLIALHPAPNTDHFNLRPGILVLNETNTILVHAYPSYDLGKNSPNQSRMRW